MSECANGNRSHRVHLEFPLLCGDCGQDITDLLIRTLYTRYDQWQWMFNQLRELHFTAKTDEGYLYCNACGELDCDVNRILDEYEATDE